MSVGIEINIKDGATPRINALLESVRPQALQKEVGEASVKLTTGHLRANGTNKRGWKSTNFWSRAARATSWTATEDGVTISINQIGVRQRFYGGTISAVNAKALTIPIASQAYGKTAADFPGAFLIRTPKGAYIVQYAGGNTTKGRFKKQAATLEFLFVLKKSVTQKEDRSVIPSMEQYGATALQQIERIIARQTGGKS